MSEKMPYPCIWSEAEKALWQRIQSHSFEAKGQAATFVSRLAQSHHWSIEEARDAIAEYCRFCFLAVTEKGSMTPSEEVDEVWHLHLTYSRDYWDVWCGQVLKRPLHHDPSSGGISESQRFTLQYAETLASYEAYFGLPNARFWPSTAQRFAARARFAIVDVDAPLVVSIATLLHHRRLRIKNKLRHLFAYYLGSL